MELLLNYICNEQGWVAFSAKFVEFHRSDRYFEGDKNGPEWEEDDIGAYRQLFHQNLIELSIWSLIYETKLADILVNYHYKRTHIKYSIQSPEDREAPKPGHVVDLNLGDCILHHFPVQASRSRRSHYSAVTRAVQEGQSGNPQFNSLDDMYLATKSDDDVRKQYHYRLINRDHRLRGYQPECVGPNGEFIVRFRVSSFTSTICIRLGPSPHSFLYEISVRPQVSQQRHEIAYCSIKMQQNKKSEELEDLQIPYNNHNGTWFTLHVSKSTFFLLADYMTDLATSRQMVNQGERCPRLITRKRIKGHTNLNWIGFASLDQDLTISSPDVDALIMDSWMKWLTITGLEKYNEAYKDASDEYDKNELLHKLSESKQDIEAQKRAFHSKWKS